jgi:6,7-dimethyl-8-ribityllumazine synthase
MDLQNLEQQTLDERGGEGLKVGIVIAQFNKDIADSMRLACTNHLIALGVSADDITGVEVPGALEVPVVLDAMAKTGNFDTLVALGSVIRGETYHFEIVSNESARGILTVQLEHGTPVANGILTCENVEQILERMEHKSRECADVAVGMVGVLDKIYER